MPFHKRFLPPSTQRGTDDLSIRRSPVSRVHTKAGLPPFVNRLLPSRRENLGNGAFVETRDKLPSLLR